jgi:ribosomal-protein-alanine N-acetyltransferase
MPMERLSTPRLILRGLTPKDAPLLLDFDLRNRSFLSTWEPQRTELYFTATRALAAVKADARSARRSLAYRWHLFLRSDPRRIVGSVALSNIVEGAFLSALLGYRLDGALTGQGLMSEAVGAVVEFAFSVLGLHRIEANVMPKNTASRRLLTRLGFEEEGLARRYLKIAGVWEDHLHHVKFNKELE